MKCSSYFELMEENMNKNKESWIALTTEPALAPELQICDPHHHLWDTPRDRYLLTELLTDLDSGHHVTQTVFVECVSMDQSSLNVPKP